MTTRRVHALFIALLFTAIALGVALRVDTAWSMDLRDDGATYAAMGDALLRTGGFLMPYGDVTRAWPTPPEPSHHYPPLYPAYLAAWYSVFGFSYAITKIANLVMSFAALVIVYATTRSVLRARGREHTLPALTVTAFVALEPHLVWSTGTGFSENAVLLLFALTMWAIIRSLDDARYILLAGVFAAAAYLTRSSLGPFFAIAGFGGLAWRFHYHRFRTFTNPWYMGAIAIFGAVFIAWASRNVAHFGWPNWETSSYTSYTMTYARTHISRALTGAFWKIPFFILLAAAYASMFAPELRRGLKKIRDEDESAHWLSAFLVFFLAWIMSVIFWTYEYRERPQDGLFWLDNHRYVVIATLPLYWIVMRHADWKSARFKLRAGAFLALSAIVSVLVVMAPIQYPEFRAAEHLATVAEPTDTLTVDCWMTKYSVYPYLTEPIADVTRAGCSQKNPACWDADWIITRTYHEIPNYRVAGSWTVKYFAGTYRSVKLFEKIGENPLDRVVTPFDASACELPM